MSNVMFLCIALALVISHSQVPQGAVYGIKFESAIKDGRPVSQKIKVAYSFNVVDKVITGDSAKLVYYPESCMDYSRITHGKMVSFRSKEEAKQAGYKKAKSKCPK